MARPSISAVELYIPNCVWSIPDCGCDPNVRTHLCGQACRTAIDVTGDERPAMQQGATRDADQRAEAPASSNAVINSKVTDEFAHKLRVKDLAATLLPTQCLFRQWHCCMCDTRCGPARGSNDIRVKVSVVPNLPPNAKRLLDHLRTRREHRRLRWNSWTVCVAWTVY